MPLGDAIASDSELHVQKMSRKCPGNVQESSNRADQPRQKGVEVVVRRVWLVQEKSWWLRLRGNQQTLTSSIGKQNPRARVTKERHLSLPLLPDHSMAMRCAARSQVEMADADDAGIYIYIHTHKSWKGSRHLS